MNYESGSAAALPPLVIPLFRSFPFGGKHSGAKFRYKGEEYEVALPGENQIYNAVTAIECFSLLSGFHLSPAHIKAGLLQTFFPARLEFIRHQPLILLDGAHNPDGVLNLCKTLDKYFKDTPVTAVCGMLKDKDYKFCIPEIAKRAKRFIATCPDNPRALSAGDSASAAGRYCQTVCACPDPLDAFSEALRQTPSDGLVVICGSLYLAGAVRGKALALSDK